MREIKVYIVRASDEGCFDNSGLKGEGYTISKKPTETGWETDSGHSSYGLKKEDAEYYAKCINEYPRLLSVIEIAEKALESVANSNARETMRRYAEEAIQAIREVTQ